MIPFGDYATEGDTIYLAVQAMHADRLTDIAKMAADMPFEEFRLLLLVFSDRLEFLHLCDGSTIGDLPDIAASKREFRDGNALDPVIGVILADHMAVHQRERPVLFVFSDGDVQTDWYKGLLPQVIKFIWLNEPTTEPLRTPFGDRREIIFAEDVPMQAKDRVEPESHLVHQDAMRHTADHPGTHAEAMLARISAEVTKQASDRRATCELCRKPHRQGCTSGVMADGSECINKPKIL
jgi:hypothetical protein